MFTLIGRCLTGVVRMMLMTVVNAVGGQGEPYQRRTQLRELLRCYWPG